MRRQKRTTKRRTQITIETERTLLIRQLRKRVDGWCAACGAMVELITAEQAAILTGLSQREICRQVEAGQLHFNETDDGRLFICLNSLANSTATLREQDFTTNQ